MSRNPNSNGWNYSGRNEFVPDSATLARAYVHAKRSVLAAGFGWEIVWQRTRPTVSLTETALLRESAWVILSAGMRETVIRSKFPALSDCFLQWRSAGDIACSSRSCFRAAMEHFGHELKIKAICTMAAIVAEKGFDTIVEEVRAAPLIALQQFPFIGPVTVFHLAKNLGIPFAKPDRHLSRLAESCGYSDTQTFCSTIAQFTGDPIDVVDIVLWRFATISSADYSGFALMAGVARS
jgi:hypothetical protein